MGEVVSTTPSEILRGMISLIEAGTVLATPAGDEPMSLARSTGAIALQPDGKLDRAYTVYPSSSEYTGGTRDRNETRRTLNLMVELGHKIPPKGGPSNAVLWQALDDETRVIQALYNGRHILGVMTLHVGPVSYIRVEGYHITRMEVEVTYDLTLRGAA